MKRIDLTGGTFGRLVALSFTHDSAGFPAWRCRCQCGKEVVVNGGNLRRGKTKSCGCFRREGIPQTTHGETKGGFAYRTREYVIWYNAKSRCFNRSNKAFHRYGGRGITMCDAWRDDYTTFLRDMGRCPAGRTLDRINNDGHYEPGNCRWATKDEQSNNNARNRRYTVGGHSYTIAQLARSYGISRKTLSTRLHALSWDLSRALTEPVKGR